MINRRQEGMLYQLLKRHIDHDEPPGMGAAMLADTIIRTTDGIGGKPAAILAARFELAAKATEGEPTMPGNPQNIGRNTRSTPPDPKPATPAPGVVRRNIKPVMVGGGTTLAIITLIEWLVNSGLLDLLK